MATVTLKGTTVHTSGELPAKGSKAPDFHLVDGNLKDVRLADYKGKKKVLNIAHSLDTGVCATSMKVFNEAAPKHPDTVFLTITADLPFAQSRFCAAENIKNAIALSMMRSRNFAKDYGVLFTDGPLAGICARSIVVLDANDKVLHAQQVREVTDEPDYAAALAALK
jgi:thiol peroxidase